MTADSEGGFVQAITSDCPASSMSPFLFVRPSIPKLPHSPGPCTEPPSESLQTPSPASCSAQNARFPSRLLPALETKGPSRTAPPSIKGDQIRIQLRRFPNPSRHQAFRARPPLRPQTPLRLYVNANAHEPYETDDGAPARRQARAAARPPWRGRRDVHAHAGRQGRPDGALLLPQVRYALLPDCSSSGIG